MGFRNGGRRGYISAHKRWQVFRQVQQAYLQTKEQQPIGASSVYLDAGERSNRLTTGGIEFCIDVEKATTKVLEDDAALLETWEKLALEQPTDPNLANDVQQKCGLEYIKRGLTPHLYFARNRYPNRRKTQ